MEKIEITQEQKQLAQTFIDLFINVARLKNTYPEVYTFLKTQYTPEYFTSNHTKASDEAILRKVITEIYLKDDIEQEKIKTSIRSNKQ